MSVKRPNILSMLADDYGAWAMGCAGNSEVKPLFVLDRPRGRKSGGRNLPPNTPQDATKTKG